MSASSLRSWVQQRGQQVQAELMEQLTAQADGAHVSPEPLETALANLPLAINAAGVMVAVSPDPKNSQGENPMARS